MTLDNFLWWSGLVAWGLLGIAGILATIDRLIEWAVDILWTKREFLAFVWDRLQRKKAKRADAATTR